MNQQNPTLRAPEVGAARTIDLDSSTCGIYTWNEQGTVEEPLDQALFSTPQGSRTVTKKEIVKTISEEIGLTQLKTKEIVQKTFDAIVDTLVEEGRIELRNFGVFEVKKRAARKARNPRTGQRVDVPEKFVVTFKPGKEMEEKVRHLEEEHQRMAMEAKEAKADSEPGMPSAPSDAQSPQTYTSSYGANPGGSG